MEVHFNDCLAVVSAVSLLNHKEELITYETPHVSLRLIVIYVKKAITSPKKFRLQKLLFIRETGKNTDLNFNYEEL